MMAPLHAGRGVALLSFVTLVAGVAGCRTAAPSSSPPPPAAVAAYTQGQAAEKAARPGEALTWYRQAWRQDPAALDAARRIAEILARLAGTDVAAQWAEEVKARRPDAPEPWRWLARICLAEDRLPEAADAAAEAARLAPEAADAQAEWAQLLRLANREREALAVLRAAGPRARPRATVIVQAGEMYVAGRKAAAAWADEAAATLKNLAAQAGGDVDAQLTLAAVYRAAGQTADALAALRKAQALAPDDARVYLQMTAVLIEARRGPEVIGLLETALGRVRSADDLRRALAQLYLRRAEENRDPPRTERDRARAIECLETAAGHQPGNPELVVQLALTRMAARQPRLAFAALRDRLPDDPEARAGAVRAILERQSASELQSQWTKLLSTSGADERGWYFVGVLAEARKQPAEALRAYARAAAAPRPDSAPFQRLVVMNADADPDAARRWVEEGLTRRPDDLQLLHLSGRLHLARREWAAAALVFQGLENRLAGEESSEPLIANRVWLTLAQQWAGQTEGAERSLRAAMAGAEASAVLEFYVRQALQQGAPLGVDLRPTRALLARLETDSACRLPAALARGLFELDIGAAGEAVAAFERALKLASADQGRPLLPAPFFYLYAQALDRAGRTGDAAAALRDCLRRQPDHAAALNHLAYLTALTGGDLDAALAQVRRALRGEPENPAYLDTLGWVLFKQGRTEDALAELRKAERAMAAEEPEILDHIGDVLDRLGRAAEAEEYWSRAFVCDPNLPGLKDKLLMRGVNLAPLQRAADQRRARGSPGLPESP